MALLCATDEDVVADATENESDEDRGNDHDYYSHGCIVLVITARNLIDLLRPNLAEAFDRQARVIARQNRQRLRHPVVLFAAAMPAEAGVRTGAR